MSEYTLLLQNCSDLIVIIDENACVFEVNTLAERVLQTSQKMILGSNIFSFCRENNIELSLSQEDFKSTLQKSDNSALEFIINNKTQQKYSLKCVPYDSKSGKKYFLIGQKLISSNTHQEYLKNIIENLPQYIYWKDKNFVYLGCNKRVADYLNLKSPDDIVGKTDHDFGWSKERINFLKESDSTVFNDRKEVFIEDQIPLDGTIRTMLTSKSPLVGHDGELLGIIGVTVDITDRKQLEEEFRKAKEQAESANIAKTEFIANMSHDIRTPLTGVIGMSEMMEYTLQNPEDKEKAHILHDSGEELLHMLNEILDDVRAGHLGEHDIKANSFDLHECINELIRLESPATTLKGLQLKANIAPEVPRYIYSDRNKIHRILLNLMGNAIKFTHSGSITLGIECLHLDNSKVHLKFDVSDTGIGVPEVIQTQVFNRFFKATSSYKGLYEGHGLGLHIAQSYVELLGGHITLTSKEGMGSTFHFDVKCTLGKAPAEVNKTVPAPQEASFTPDKALHLLLVEDNPMALKTLEFLLAQKQYTFVSATTGEEAWALLNNQHFDLMITDIGLPGISGTELSQRVRKQEQSLHKPHLSIIGLTGHAREAALEECLHSGMDEVLSKPAQIEQLHRCIQEQGLITKEHLPAPSTPKTSLGLDLPATKEELFQLEPFSLFDEAMVLQQIPDKQALITILSLYLTEQQDITLMQQEYEQQNWDQIEKLAHKIKSGVAYLGTQRMYRACQYLERYYKTGHKDLLEPLYQQFLEVNEQTNRALQLWLKRNRH
ncbi:ATP-binding protein [Legionella shakespearei]|nr:ATP-binding protein [Legionella shakespearei]